VFVRDVLEVVGAVLRYKQRDGDGFYGGVAPAMVVDTASSVDVVNIVAVLRRPPHVEIRQLKVGPEDAAARPLELGSDGTLVHKVGDGRPQPDDARPIVSDDHREAVLDTTVAHQSEDVVTDWSGDVRVIIESPDILKADENWLLVQRLGVETTHVTITNSLEADAFRHR